MTGSGVITNVRGATTGKPVDCVIRDGRIAQLATPGRAAAGPALAGEGFLLAPAFIEPHFHLDKCFSTAGATPRASLDEHLALIARNKQAYTVEDVAERACRAGLLLASRGVGHVRSFADVDSFAGLTALQGLLEAKRRLADVLTVQIVAFPQHGIRRDPGTDKRLEEAMRLGADVVGGHPQLEGSEADGDAHIDTVFGLARTFGVDVDFHVDETDRIDSLWLERCARKALANRYEGRITVAHACSVPKQPREYRLGLYALLKDAGVSVVSSPTSGLLFRGLDQVDPPRGTTAVRELLEHGVNVACGQELFRSVFSPHLRLPDPLLTGQLMAYIAQMADTAGLETIFQMLIGAGARALRLDPYGLAEGAPADLVLLKADSIADAFTTLSPERIVFKRGTIVARSEYRVEVAGGEVRV
jgi:cytosine deaminase